MVRKDLLSEAKAYQDGKAKRARRISRSADAAIVRANSVVGDFGFQYCASPGDVLFGF